MVLLRFCNREIQLLKANYSPGLIFHQYDFIT